MPKYYQSALRRALRSSERKNEVDQVKPNSKIRITNGFVKEFQGELTVTAGKFGKLEVLEDKEE